MSGVDPKHSMDHIVVVMFENRSFDNLLGYLYEPGEVASFEGVAGRNLSNPIPDYAPSANLGVVPVHPAKNMNTPNPDPGEEYQHVNTQLFRTVSPPDNRFKLADAMAAPFNAPDDPARQPAMDGFVTDYINAFYVETGRMPRYDEYAQIMACYTPEMMPVFSTLARGFACFDHWFCEVPSQTFTNRSFFHARRLFPFFMTHFSSIHDFYEDAERGTLPAYSFIEPNMLHGHNDMHPPVNALFGGLSIDPPSSLLGGEAYLAKIYDAIRASSASGGSNFANTLLLVAFDEHGGTYDHVPPPPASPPDPTSPVGQMGFRFNRSGIRLPILAISAYIDSHTVVNEEYRSTSLIRTLRERRSLGGPLTARDAIAADIAPILKRETPRPPEDWPDVVARHVPPLAETLVRLDRLLPPLGKYLLGTALALEKLMIGHAPEINVNEATGREALAYFDQFQAATFPGIARGRTV